MNFEEINALLVDDHKGALAATFLMLKTIGLTDVQTARDGKEALEIIDSDKSINLILCDWNMPQMSGIEFLRQVRSTDQKTPFIMITARGDKDSVLEAQQSDATSYILKPFSTEELSQKIAQAMEL